MLTLERACPRGLAGPSHSLATSDAAPELARAFEAACDDSSSDANARLHDVTVALVERLKADALAPERVLITLKTAIATHAHEHRLPSLIEGDDGPTHHGEAYRQLFASFLASYFT